MSRLWVVPCLYDPVVHDCVASIREHYPDDEIMVVDADSPELGYLERLGADEVVLNNKHYGTGAWRYALDSPADYFCLIQDSIICQTAADLDRLRVLRWFDEKHGHDARMEHYIRAECGRMGIDPEPLTLTDDDDTEHKILAGVFGPILFTPRADLERLENLGVLDCYPNDKTEASAMERIVGLALTHLGVDFISTAIDGKHTHPDDSYPGSPFRKVFLDRQA